MFQRQAVQKFHGKEDVAVLVINFVDRTDVGVIQGGGCLNFPLKTAES
jgi:hypothetical protein